MVYGHRLSRYWVFSFIPLTARVFAQHSIQADKPVLHSYVHIPDHKQAHKNGNIHLLISTKLSEILESSVQQLIYKTVPITNSLMQTEHTSINYAPATPITRQIRHQINEDLTPEFWMRISTQVQKPLSIVPCSNRTTTKTYTDFKRPDQPRGLVVRVSDY